MNEYFFIPTSSLNFNNILSSESISPAAFYEKRGFGFKRFEKVKANPFANTLLAYSSIPLFELDQGEREEFGIYIVIPESLLPSSVQSFTQKNIRIHQIDAPVYINCKYCFFIVISEVDRRKLQATSERSLEVKNEDLYLSKIKTLSEINFHPFDWDDTIIQNITDLKTVNHEKLVFDQQLNKVKGFLYGWISGSLKEDLPEMTSAKRYFQEFVNTFSGLMNELSILTKKSKKARSQNAHIKKELTHLEDLKVKINTLFNVTEKDEISDLIKTDFNIEDATIDQWKALKYQASRISVFSIVSAFIKRKNPDINTVDDLLNQLLQQAKDFLYYATPKSYELLEESFNSVRLNIRQKIAELENQSIASNNVEQIPFVINKELSIVDSYLKGLNADENRHLKIIIEELLSRTELATSDEIGQQRHDVITGVANKLKAKSESSKDNFPERGFLARLYKSLQTVGIGFKPGETESRPLQAFACFLSRYSDMSKFQDFLEKNKLKEFSLAYAVWGAAYGYANISKLLLEPLKVNHSALNLIQGFIHEFIYEKDVSHLVKETSTDYTKKDRNRDTSVTVEWTVSDESKAEKVEDHKSNNLLEKLLLENKKLGKNTEWVSHIVRCAEQALNAELIEGSLLSNKEQRVEFFVERMKERAKKMDRFGKVKIEESVVVFRKYLQLN